MVHKQSIMTKIIVFMGLFLTVLIGSMMLVFSFVSEKEVERSAHNSVVFMGEKIIAKLDEKMGRAESLAMALANLGENLDLDHEKNKQLINELLDMEGYKGFIAGGGIWPEPYLLDPNKERASYFFGRDSDGVLQFYDDYNDPAGRGYHREEWYVPARFHHEGQAYWSRSYVDPYSLQPMVTVTIPMYKEGRFFGVSTVDIMLDGLHGFLEENTKALGGYGFLLDRNGKFITYPDEEAVKVQEGALPDRRTIDELVTKEPGYEALLSVLKDMGKENLRIDRFDAKVAEQIYRLSDQIEREDARQIASIIQEKSDTSAAHDSHYRTLLLEDDPLLKTHTLAVIFDIHNTYWKVVVAVPSELVLQQSTSIFRELLISMILIVALVFILGYFVMRKILVSPIIEMSTQLEQASGNYGQILDVPRNDELGLLAHSFNERTKELLVKSEELEALSQNLEKEVRRRTQELDQAQHDAHLGSYVYHIDTETIEWSDEHYRIFNVSKETFHPDIESYMAFVHPEDKAFVGSEIAAALNDRKMYTFEYRIVLENGKQLYVRSTAQVTRRSAEGEPLEMVGTILDVTELKTNEIALKKQHMVMMQQSKLAQIGELLNMIAHQWRQPLNILGLGLTNIELNNMLGQLDSDEAAAQMRIMQEQISYMSHTIDDFRSFFQEDKETDEMNLLELVEESIGLLGGIFASEGIAIETEIEPTLFVNVYPNEFKQVLLNILNNAKDALLQQNPENKTIKIRSRAGEYGVALTIEDNAGGIPKASLNKIFDPYFTTKFESNGTGLGLYMSKIIVEEHHQGQLKAENGPEGARFKIELPKL